MAKPRKTKLKVDVYRDDVHVLQCEAKNGRAAKMFITLVDDEGRELESFTVLRDMLVERKGSTEVGRCVVRTRR